MPAVDTVEIADRHHPAGEAGRGSSERVRSKNACAGRHLDLAGLWQGAATLPPRPGEVKASFTGDSLATSGAELSPTPACRGHADGALEFATEVIDVAKAAGLGDFGEGRLASCNQRLRMDHALAQQPLPRAGAQMPAKQPPRL